MADLIAGKYEILSTIGKGGMGTVYKARQTNLDRVVAIKMLSEELASDPEFRARFQQEATVVARLNHPNIVQIHDIVAHNNTFCIIMEYLEGENLQAKIDRDITVPEKDLILIGAQIARALGYAHDFGIVHRDIKPDNIHVLPNGVAKVMDFGIARFLDSKLKTQTGISMGTPKFMSPEQVTGKNVDGQTDLYSLGICLYYCLTGQVPFDGDNAITVATRHLYEQPEPISRLNPSVSPETEKVVMKALEKQKPNRYRTGNDMAIALEGSMGIKTPIRISEDGISAHYAGATQRVPVGNYGVNSSDISIDSEMPSNSDEELYSTNSEPVMQEGDSLSPRTIKHLTGMENFYTPRRTNLSSVKDPTKQFRLSLKILAGIAVVGIAFILALLFAVNKLTNQELPIPNDKNTTNQTQSQDSLFKATELQSKQLLEQGKNAEARHLWTSFQSKYPSLSPNEVREKIDSITSQLPLSEVKLLSERRRAIGMKYLNQNSMGSLAYAYLDSARKMDNSKSDDLTTGILRMLAEQNRTEPDHERVVKASEVYDQAKIELEKNSFSKIAEKLLLQTISLDYSNSVYWLKLGDYYQNSGLIDDARIMYSQAAQLARTPNEQATITQKLDRITNTP